MRSRCRSAEQALALARRVGAREAEVRALTVLGGDLAYLGRGEEGLAQFRQALQLAEEIGDRVGLERAYVQFHRRADDAGTAPRVGATGAGGARGDCAGTGSRAPCSSRTRSRRCSRSATGTRPNRLSAAALRGITSSFPYLAAHHPRRRRDRPRRVRRRASAPRGRGRRPARGPRARPLRRATSQSSPSGSAAGRTPTAAIDDGLARARQREAAQIRVQLCAKGLRAQAELAALARARRDGDALRDWLDRAREAARPSRARAAAEAAADHAERRRLARRWPRPSTSAPAATHGPSRGRTRRRPGTQLERPPLAAYCRWRQAEALVAAGAPRAEASVPLREAHAVATRIGAQPLLRELELLAERARLDLAPPDAGPADAKQDLEELLGLTPREAEVLTLVARGYTNREIADDARDQRQDRRASTSRTSCASSTRRTGVEAAAIAHRLEVPGGTPAELGP